MIELIAAAVSGAVVGGGVVWWKWGQLVPTYKSVAYNLLRNDVQTFATLTALRSNCFIPDERGVKVRYSQASVERRVKAETPKERA